MKAVIVLWIVLLTVGAVLALVAWLGSAPGDVATGSVASIVAPARPAPTPLPDAASLVDIVATPELIDLGREVALMQGCLQCHTPDGMPAIGPTFLGYFGSTVETNDGTLIKVDAEHVVESIIHPTRRVMQGYDPVMASYDGMIDEGEMRALLAYIQSLGVKP
jgi:cytochrome c oxidase subunit 2